MKRLALASLAAAVIALTGCTTAPTSQPTATKPGATKPAATGSPEQILARHNLAGLSAEQVVEKLDASQDDRANGPVGSVKPNEVVLTDDEGQAALPLPAGKFYLAFAPYLTRTHDCFNHNLATCQGELASTEMHVNVTATDGRAIVDQKVTTHPNGFAGLWLPADITGKITVTYDGKTAAAPISTGAQDPTCLTTLKLGG